MQSVLTICELKSQFFTISFFYWTVPPHLGLNSYLDESLKTTFASTKHKRVTLGVVVQIFTFKRSLTNLIIFFYLANGGHAYVNFILFCKLSVKLHITETLLLCYVYATGAIKSYWTSFLMFIFA